ncbi:hypothetical protein AA313_de0203552 [Arthrobotrys entomopaga]|nr:hypothetical protein AA313_de0203552 [Arthrobotrys entomopaga]
MATDISTEDLSSSGHIQPEIDTLVIDTGPIIQNVCSPQSLLATSGKLVTLPSVVSEIRDATTRARFETSWAPFLQYRSPRPDSIKYVSNFARKTGDYGVLGATDLQVLALTFEIECENLGGPQEFEKRLKQKEEEKEKASSGRENRRRGRERKGKQTAAEQEDVEGQQEDDEVGWTTIPISKGRRNNAFPKSKAVDCEPKEETKPIEETSLVTSLDSLHLDPASQLDETLQFTNQIVHNEPEVNTDSEDDWITPDNLAVHLTSEGTTAIPATKATPIPTACCTTDFAMQNVLLQLHIQLFSPASMSRITSVKSHVLRCHACFKIERDMSRQFCPSCGQPSLTKVSCSTDSNGVFRVHLKKNWQWNNRGNVFSMAKPQHGTASMKGVRENIVLSEDQREYEKAVKESKRTKERDLMDRDYLPGLLTGERLGHGGNPKVGAGRNVNASKRRGK